LYDYSITNYELRHAKNYYLNGIRGHNGKKNVIQAKPLREIIFYGRICRDKGIEKFLKISNLFFNDERLKFSVYGIIEYPDFLEVIKSHNVSYKGRVQPRDVDKIFNPGALLLNLSERDGFGLVNIEAASNGVPVIGYNIVGIKDSIVNNKTGHLIEYQLNDDYVEKINGILLYYLDNEADFIELQRSALAYAKDSFSIKVIDDMVIKTINENL